MIIICTLDFLFALVADILIFIAIASGAVVAYEWLTAHFAIVIIAFLFIIILECVVNKFGFRKDDKDYSTKTFIVHAIINKILILTTLYLLLFKMQTFQDEHGFTYILCMICAIGTFSGSTFSALFSGLSPDIDAIVMLDLSIISLGIILVSVFVPSPFIKLVLCAISGFIGLAPITVAASD